MSLFLASLDAAIYYAFFGAFSIKLLELAELHKVPKVERPDLKDWVYWIPFIVLPFIGAGLAHVHISSNTELSAMLAVNIGVSAPLILRAFAQVNPLEQNTIKTPNDA
ncbi:hypothetical protein GLP37_00710 [Photobacterium phosphoreum]|uniref:hypothetical protein n=1 Tax=Photobacterium TaxID=657 RepID=UPI001E3B4015|nr:MULTISPECIES: hypothetical protein [Photobacterium]MCD9500713.1 hypothetical protein [Photobacterium phosphoreum]MEC6906214.1 hypothetical protein [Photobacterium piscicola]